MAADPVDQFLLRYVVTHKCGALFDHLTDKDQRALTFAARGVVQEMPSYEVPDAVDGLEKPEQLLSGELVPLWWDFLRVSLNPLWFQAIAPVPSRIYSSELPPL